MENDVLFSIIVPVYNCENYVRRCVKSILGQTENRFECIFVDDGSTDESAKIIQSLTVHDPRVKILVQANKGQSAARNRAMTEASGQYLVFIDADDFVSKDALNKIKKTVLKYNPEVMIFNTFAYDDKASRVIKRTRIPEKNYHKGIEFFQDLSSVKILFSPWAAVVKKKYIDDAEIYFSEGISHGEDEVWLTKVLLLAKKIRISNEAYYYNTVDREGSLSAEISMRRVLSILEVIDELLEFSKGKDNQIKDIVKRKCQGLLVSALAMYHKAGRDREIEEVLMKHIWLVCGGRLKYRLLGIAWSMFGISCISRLCMGCYFFKKK